MSGDSSQPARGTLYRKCARCGYFLRGLPRRYACPECGLGYDERCVYYRVTNPRQFVLFCIMMIGGGWSSLRFLPHLLDIGGASAAQLIGALASVAWLVVLAVVARILVGRYRRGLGVAITADGLVVRLPGFQENLITWDRIDSATVMERTAVKPQIALLQLRDGKKPRQLGGVANIFPERPDVESFVQEVNRRVRERAAADVRVAGPRPV